MNTTLHLMVTLWGALAVQGLALAAGLLILGRGRIGTGVPVLGALGVGCLAASHWMAWVPGISTQWPSLAFMGALLLPAVVLLQLEHEAGQPSTHWRKATVLTGAFLPAVLLPAQIVGQTICLLPDQCGPAAPYIVLMHLGTASLLILLALPALGQLSRQRRTSGQRRLGLSTGGLLIGIALVHLGGLLGGLGMPQTSRLLMWELSQAAVQLVLMQMLTLVSLGHWLRPTVSITEASVLQTLGAADVPPVLDAIEAPMTLAAAIDPEKQRVTDNMLDSLEEGTPAQRNSLGDPGILNSIGQRAVQMLRDESLYRQPQLRRKDLADKLEVPDYLLSRALNASQGQSFIDLVNGMRLTEAKQRLISGHEAIATIAFDVGFNSLASFNRAFRDDTGTSPSEFRHGLQTPANEDTLLPPRAQAA